MYTSILLERSKTVSKLLCSLVFTRPMGGGPRTFPGGVNKWQWKRMHEKRAQEKEKRLLEQEKQLYQARIRSQIRAKLAGKPDPSPSPPDPSSSHGPMSPTDHIKALADRFMKEGAEDLWNEDDGPLKSPPPQRPNERSGFIGANGRRGSIGGPPIDLRKFITEKGENVNSTNFDGNYVNKRNYSAQRSRFRRNESEESEDDDLDYGPVRESVKKRGNLAGNRGNLMSLRNAGQRRELRRNESSRSDDDDFKNEAAKFLAGNSRQPRVSVGGEEEEEDENKRLRDGRGVRKVGSSASLGKYDVKITKRVPLQLLDKESDFSGEVELIRHELRKKSLGESGGKRGEEESILSQKRYAMWVY